MTSQSFPVDGPVRATVRLAVGEISVTTDDSGEARASVEPSDPGNRAAVELAASAVVKLEDGELLVEAGERGGWMRRGHGSGLQFRLTAERLHVRLTLPTGSSVSSATGVVTFTSDGRLDEVSIKTGAGTVDVAEAAGVNVRGGTANVTVGAVGTVSFTCGRGDLRVASADDVFVKTAQGSVDIASSSGKVQVKGAMLSLDVHQASGGDISFETAMGNATVGVVAGTTVDLDLSSTVGDARSELSMDEDSSGESQGAALRIRLRTTSGDVVVSRAATAQPASVAS